MEIKDCKKILMDELHEVGIPEFEIIIKDYKNHPKGYLGCYRSLSQFKSKSIISIDLEAHENILKEMENYSEVNLMRAVKETLLHHKDFAETFSRWKKGREILPIKKEEDLIEIVNHFVVKVFENESIAWVKQEKWKRELDYFLDKNEKSFSKYSTQDGAFNKCLQVSEAIAGRIKDCVDNVKILRLTNYNGDLSKAYSGWKKIENFFVVHYVLLFDNIHVVDLAAKQSEERNPAGMISSMQVLEKDRWDITVHCDYSKTKTMKL